MCADLVSIRVDSVLASCCVGACASFSSVMVSCQSLGISPLAPMMIGVTFTSGHSHPAWVSMSVIMACSGAYLDSFLALAACIDVSQATWTSTILIVMACFDSVLASIRSGLVAGLWLAGVIRATLSFQSLGTRKLGGSQSVSPM